MFYCKFMGVNELKKIKPNKMNKPLKLSEKLFCLVVNPKKGGILLSASSALGMTLTGSIFIELMNKEIVSIENKRVRLINPSLQSDDVHEFLLRKIREHKRDRKIRVWISYFSARKRKLQKLFIRDLVRRNVLRTEERRILFIPYEKVFLMDRSLVDSVVKEVENAVFGREQRTEESLTLAVLVAKSNLLSRIFPERSRRKEALRILKKIPDTEISNAIQDAIQIARTATYAAIS